MPDINDRHLTAAGLLLEAAAGLRRRLETVQAGHGLSFEAYDALLRLARSPGGRLLVDDLAVQAPNGEVLPRVVADLERAGFVRHDVSELGQAMLAVTVTGRIRLEEATREVVGVVAADVVRVLGDDAEAVLRALRRVRDHLHPGAAADRR